MSHMSNTVFFFCFFDSLSSHLMHINNCIFATDPGEVSIYIYNISKIDYKFISKTQRKIMIRIGSIYVISLW